MRSYLAVLTVISFGIVLSPEKTAAAKAEERRYCTQSGPFILRFEDAQAAGIFKALPGEAAPEPGPGAVTGEMPGLTLTGDWITPNARGPMRIGFSEDKSSFVVAYAMEDDPDNWRKGWMGYLPPAGDPSTFVIEGETFHCD